MKHSISGRAFSRCCLFSIALVSVMVLLLSLAPSPDWRKYDLPNPYPKIGYLETGIRKIIPATGNGKSGKLFYMDDPLLTEPQEKAVYQILFVCDDDYYNTYANVDDPSPGYVREVIYHDIGEDEYVGIIVEDPLYNKKTGERWNTWKHEVQIDDDAANELIDLICDRTDFVSHCIHTITVTTSPKRELPTFKYDENNKRNMNF